MQAEPRRPPEGRFRRLAWFLALYLMSLAAFTVLVYGLREVIPH